MKTYIEQGEYRCALLEPEDWEIYKTMCLEYVDTAEEKAALAHEDFFRDDVASEQQKHMVLFHGNRPIGIGSIFLDGTNAYMDNLLVTPAYRGRGLVDLLHQARLKYAAEQAHLRYAVVDVLPSNRVAIQALERNGFTLKDDQNGGPLQYIKNLDELRPGGPGPEPQI